MRIAEAGAFQVKGRAKDTILRQELHASFRICLKKIPVFTSQDNQNYRTGEWEIDVDLK